jgi:hypothetical protein
VKTLIIRCKLGGIGILPGIQISKATTQYEMQEQPENIHLFQIKPW